MCHVRSCFTANESGKITVFYITAFEILDIWQGIFSQKCDSVNSSSILYVFSPLFLLAFLFWKYNVTGVEHEPQMTATGGSSLHKVNSCMWPTHGRAMDHYRCPRDLVIPLQSSHYAWGFTTLLTYATETVSSRFSTWHKKNCQSRTGFIPGLSLNTLILRSIQVVACGDICPFQVCAVLYDMSTVYHPVFIHSTVERHSDCLFFVTFINNNVVSPGWCGSVGWSVIP